MNLDTEIDGILTCAGVNVYVDRLCQRCGHEKDAVNRDATSCGMCDPLCPVVGYAGHLWNGDEDTARLLYSRLTRDQIDATAAGSTNRKLKRALGKARRTLRKRADRGA